MRLIDADKLMEKSYCAYIMDNCYDNCYLRECVVDVADIKVAPTIEAEPVRHGHWEESCNELDKYCSECKEVCGTIYERENYCPNCGAKMEEVEK